MKGWKRREIIESCDIRTNSINNTLVKPLPFNSPTTMKIGKEDTIDLEEKTKKKKKERLEKRNH